jgi:hypothetical protein
MPGVGIYYTMPHGMVLPGYSGPQAARLNNPGSETRGFGIIRGVNDAVTANTADKSAG